MLRTTAWAFCQTSKSVKLRAGGRSVCISKLLCADSRSTLVIRYFFAFEAAKRRASKPTGRRSEGASTTLRAQSASFRRGRSVCVSKLLCGNGRSDLVVRYFFASEAKGPSFGARRATFGGRQHDLPSAKREL